MAVLPLRGERRSELNHPVILSKTHRGVYYIVAKIKVGRKRVSSSYLNLSYVRLRALVHFVLFLHVNFLFVLVVKFVFKEGELLVGHDVYAETILQFPK